MRERVEAMKAIWTKSKPEYHGEHVKFPPMMTWPKPVQKPHPPVIVGGAFPYGARRAIAYGDGWMRPTWPRAGPCRRDGTVWTFKLRKGVQFHKGFGELTAEDVKFSFERQIKRTPGTLLRRQPRPDQGDRGRRPAHRADRPEGL